MQCCQHHALKNGEGKKTEVPFKVNKTTHFKKKSDPSEELAGDFLSKSLVYVQLYHSSAGHCKTVSVHDLQGYGETI